MTSAAACGDQAAQGPAALGWPEMPEGEALVGVQRSPGPDNTVLCGQPLGENSRKHAAVEVDKEKTSSQSLPGSCC